MTEDKIEEGKQFFDWVLSNSTFLEGMYVRLLGKIRDLEKRVEELEKK